MLQIAKEDIEKMGINNTQYISVRHTDRDYPHCHIVSNRVDNDGKAVSDKNDRYRNEKVCKMITAKHGSKQQSVGGTRLSRVATTGSRRV